MRYFSSARALSAPIVLGCLLASGFSGHMAEVQADTVPVSQSTFVPRDTETVFHDPSGSVRLYIAPVGIPHRGSTYFRDTSLATTGSTLSSPNTGKLPFTIQVAGTNPTQAITTTTSLVTLANEGGVTLGLQPISPTGAAPTVGSSQVNGNTISFAGAIPVAASGAPGADLAVRATVAGIDVRATLGSAVQAGSLTFALAPDKRIQLTQGAGGAILGQRTIPLYRDDGSVYAVQHPVDYVIARPIVRDANPDPIAQATTGPVTMTLDSRSPGSPQITLTVDPVWLRDPHRVFPVAVDLPVTTGLAASKSGLFGTLSSCAPNIPAPLSRVVVGTVGSCRYHGQMYIDVSSILPGTPIQSATLNLYTPQQGGTTGVTLAQNASPAGGLAQPPAPWNPATWDSASAINPPAVAQSATNGHWQQWDISDFVRQWVNGGTTQNNGLTLVGGGAPVLFASPLGVGDDGPDVAPYLNISFGPRPAQPAVTSTQGGVTPLFGVGDGASNIFGLSQGIARDYNSPNHGADCAYPTLRCGNGIVLSAFHQYLHGSFVRIKTLLSCSTPPINQSQDWPGWSWWNNVNGNNVGPSGGYHAYDLMEDAYNDGLIPVVLLDISGCAPTTSTWIRQVKNFIQDMHQEPGMPANLPQTYFEIMNEPAKNPYVGSTFPTYYPPVFAAAAQAIVPAVQRYNQNGGTIRGRIITSGVEAPSDNLNTCPGFNSIQTIDSAIKAAEGTQQGADPTVGSGFLGVATHPYGYATPWYINPPPWWVNMWLNYGQDYQSQGHDTTNACTQLDQMLNLWTSYDAIQNMPLLVTEINAGLIATPTDTNREGEYLTDLFTWLHDYGPTGGPSVSSPWTDVNNQNVRVLWYTGVDQGNTLGLYGSSGTSTAPEKSTSIGSNRYTSTGGLYCYYNAFPNGSNQNLSAIYPAVAGASCY